MECIHGGLGKSFTTPYIGWKDKCSINSFALQMLGHDFFFLVAIVQPGVSVPPILQGCVQCFLNQKKIGCKHKTLFFINSCCMITSETEASLSLADLLAGKAS